MKFRIRFADQIVGLFLLLVLLGLAAVLVLVGVNQRWFARNYAFESRFPTGDGLSVGMPIYLKGFQVGKVSTIILNDQNEVDVVFFIEDTYYPKMKPDTVLELATSAIGLGSSLRLLPGLNQLPPLPEHSLIPILDSAEGQLLAAEKKIDVPKGEDVIGSVIGKLNPILDETRQTVAQIRRVVTSVDEAFSGKGGPVGTMVADLSGTPARVNRTVDDVTARIDTLLDRVTTIADNLNGVAQQAGGIVTQATGVVTQVSGVVTQASGTVTNLTKNLDAIAQNLQDMTADLKNTQGLAKRLLDPKGSVDTILDDSNRLYDQIDSALKSANGVIAQIRGFVDFINSTRPQVSSILEKGSDTLSSAKDVLEAAKNNPLLKGGVPAPAAPSAPLNSYRDENF